MKAHYWQFLIFILLSLHCSILTEIITTKDKAFQKIYHPSYINDGDGKTFPKDGQYVAVHVSVYNAVTNALYHTTVETKQPYLHLLGYNYPNAKCLSEVIERMSLGEKTYFICPPESMFGNDWGMGGKIPGGIDLGVLIELKEIKTAQEVEEWAEKSYAEREKEAKAKIKDEA